MLLDQERLEADILSSAEPVLVDFFATWCGPCKLIAPTIDKIAEDGYRVIKVNAEDHPELTTRFRVGAFPTLLVVKGGEVVARFVGVQRMRTLTDALDRAGTTA
jgi:thioredoxin 1